MAGECYALSHDLVGWLGRASRAETLTRGNEDQLTAKMLREHPDAASIRYEAQRCWIYDHPKAGTV